MQKIYKTEKHLEIFRLPKKFEQVTVMFFVVS